MKVKRRAFTLAELMIGIIVFSLLGLAISKLMTNTQRQAAKGRAKSVIHQELKTITMYLQRDIEGSRVVYNKDEKKYENTLDEGNPISKIETAKRKHGDDTGTDEDVSYFDAYENDDDDPTKKEYEVVSYSIADGVLTRSVDGGGSHVVANHVVSIEKEDDGTYDFKNQGKVRLVIKLEVETEVYKDKCELEDHIVISIRQLQNKINVGDNAEDKNKWRQRIGKDDY